MNTRLEELEVSPSRFTLVVAPYPLERADFMILKTCGASAWKFAAWTFAVSIGAGLPVFVDKIGAWIESQPFDIGVRDSLMIGAPLVLSVMALVVGFVWPSERRKLCKRISKHFSDNPSKESGSWK